MLVTGIEQSTLFESSLNFQVKYLLKANTQKLQSRRRKGYLPLKLQAELDNEPKSV